MDDFLHNLRSGKLKQPDRGRRDYTDYKGPQRRAGNERRRTDYYAKVTNENFALIKDTLDVLAANQKRIADTIANQSKMSARIANSLEALVVMVGRHYGFEELIPGRNETAVAELGTDATVSTPPSEPITEGQAGGQAADDRFDEGDEPDILDLIASMRAEGDSWEKIARHFDDQQIPTLSGKGKWRGPAVKKLWDANCSDDGM